MSSATNGGEGETRGVCGLPSADLRAVISVRVGPWDPVISGGAQVHLLSDPLGSTSPGDDGIGVTRVDEDSNTGAEEGLVVGQHAGTGGCVGKGVRANGPLDVARDMKSTGSDGTVEVVGGIVGVNAWNLLLSLEELCTVDGIGGREESLHELLSTLEPVTSEARSIDMVRVDAVIVIVGLVQSGLAGVSVGV